MDNKKEKIYKLNNVIISAFGTKSDISKPLIEQNESFKDVVSKDALTEFSEIKKGAKMDISVQPKPSFESAMQNLVDKNYANAICQFAELYKKNPDDFKVLKCMASALLAISALYPLNKYLLKDLEKHSDDVDILNIIANSYLGDMKLSSYRRALPLFEELVQKNENFDIVYKFMYVLERVYQNEKLDLQIKYAERACELEKNRGSHNAEIFIAKLYARNGQVDKALKVLDGVPENDKNRFPLHFAKAMILMKCGRITEGFDHYRYRFDYEKVSYPVALVPEKRLQNIEDVKGKTVIIHFEQGFGDSVMFSRYVQDISKYAKKTIFVVQKNLISLFKSSGFEDYCTLLSHEADISPDDSMKDDKISRSSKMIVTGAGMARIDHDYHIPLMDTPYLLNISPENIGHEEGFLCPSEDKLKNIKKYINKNKKFKIGISFHGTKDSNPTYRDIPVSKLAPLFEMAGVEVYSLQVDEHSAAITKIQKRYKNLINLKPHLYDFEDTAAAMMCMDLIVSTDNVVMNLAGALGVRTYGLFNVFSEHRWYKTEGDDIGWYKSVKPIRAKKFNDWNGVVKEVIKNIKQEFDV